MSIFGKLNLLNLLNATLAMHVRQQGDGNLDLGHPSLTTFNLTRQALVVILRV